MGWSRNGSIMILTRKLKFYTKILDVEKSAALKGNKNRLNLSLDGNSRFHMSIWIVAISATLEGWKI